MTTTEADFEARLRRDLAELGAVPSSRERELAAEHSRRPALTVGAALLAVMALVAGSFAIVRGTDHRHSAAVAVPRVHTILEQPAAVTGSSSSILAHGQSQVCGKWTDESGGVDCRDLQARFVWSPGATKGPYTFWGIEVVGTPDPKLQNAPNATYPIFETVTVHGHRARLFGTARSLTLLWQERSDLQVFMSVALAPSARPGSTSLRSELLAFATAMRPVAVDPESTQYILQRATTPIVYSGSHTVRVVAWDLSWRARDRRLCVTVDGRDQCLTPVTRGAELWARGVTIVEDCPQPWVGTQGIVFGAAPSATRAVEVSSTTRDESGSKRHTVPVVAPPGEPGLRVFAVALDHPATAVLAARNGAGATLASDTLPPFAPACS
jgi:hypothetical protein